MNTKNQIICTSYTHTYDTYNYTTCEAILLWIPSECIQMNTKNQIMGTNYTHTYNWATREVILMWFGSECIQRNKTRQLICTEYTHTYDIYNWVIREAILLWIPSGFIKRNKASNQFVLQPIAFRALFHFNLQSQSHSSLFRGTWQKRPRELENRKSLRFEKEETTL